MSDLKEVFEMITKQTEPDKDSWKEQERLQRRMVRNRRLGAFALVAALIAGLAIVFAVTRPNHGSGPAGTNHPSQPPLSTGSENTVVAGLDGSTITTVPGLPVDAFALSLSSDGTQIAFVTASGQDILLGVSSGVNHIATIGTDGKGMRVLGAGTQPAFSPDGSRIAYADQNHLYVMNADGSGRMRLTSGPTYDEFPQWSPDGGTIVYDNLGAGSRSASQNSGFADTSEIMTVPAAGGSPTRLTHNNVSESEPAYSPDGKSIAYRHGGQIWVMDADGTHAHAVVTGATEKDVPRWSPDGKYIAFTAYTGDTRALYLGELYGASWPVEHVRLLHVATGKVTKVGNLGMATFNNTPQWLPNSRGLLLALGPKS